MNNLKTTFKTYKVTVTDLKTNNKDIVTISYYKNLQKAVDYARTVEHTHYNYEAQIDGVFLIEGWRDSETTE